MMDEERAILQISFVFPERSQVCGCSPGRGYEK
jgi:hypothetical protein